MSTIIGLAGLAFSLYYVFTAPSSGFTGYIDIPSMVLLGLCPPSIMLLSHSVFDLLMGIKLLMSAMFSRQKSSQKEIINTLSHASALVRTEGLGALMKVKDHTRYELLRDGFALIVNNFTTDEIQHNLMARIEGKQTKMSLAANLFENMAKLCPGVGMIGTLIGLIAMLANLNDPSKLGAGMAMAMITTLYGLLLGTALYGPWGEKIALEAEKIIETDLLVLEGVLNIKSKKSSLHMSSIMKTYAGKQSAAAAKSAKK